MPRGEGRRLGRERAVELYERVMDSLEMTNSLQRWVSGVADEAAASGYNKKAAVDGFLVEAEARIKQLTEAEAVWKMEQVALQRALWRNKFKLPVPPAALRRQKGRR